MTLFSALYGTILLIYIAIWMGMILRWNDTTGDEKKNWSKAWHGWSLVIRFGAIAIWLPFFWDEWLTLALLMMIYGNLSWTFYDGICNWFRKLSFWYIGSASSGTGSWWDKLWTEKSSRVVKIILMALTIGYVIIYIVIETI